jgi:hypothetical protein
MEDFMTIEMNVIVRALGWVALIVSATGCGAENSAPEEPSPVSLTQGARGPEVRAAYEYLRQFGYFPNAELERDNPDFRPMVPAPADPELFDQNLAAGLRKFQKNAGIDVTGELDAATQALIGQPRCGMPDEDPDADRDSKWGFFNTSNRWNTLQPEITYRISTAGCGADCLPNSPITTAEARGLINRAIASWETYTYADFTEVTTGGEIIINYVTNSDPNLLGYAAPPGPPLFGLQGPTIWIHKNYPFGPVGFQDMITHEFGHVMGLRHTPETMTINGALFHAHMWPWPEQFNIHLPGDSMGASVALGAFSDDMGINDVIDADANGFGASDRVWALQSTSPFAVGGQAMQFTSGTSWTTHSAMTGTSIAVCPDNTAYVRRATGGISAWSGSSWVTQAMPLGLTARAVGCQEGRNADPFLVYAAMSNGNVYSKPPGGFWSNLGGPGGTVNEVDAAANGVVYALKSNGELWQRKSGSWSRHSTKLFNDIGVGGDDSLTNIWAIDTNQMGWAWAEQAQIGSEGPFARWEPINEPGPMKRIGASRNQAFAIWATSSLDGNLYGRTIN